jgi:hypothetical protein
MANLEVPILNLGPRAVQPVAPQNKKVVICITRNIDDDDLKLLNEYGKVLSYDHDLHNNLDCDLFDWAYLIIDIRESQDRYYYMKHIQNKKDKYLVVLYKYGFEKSDLNLNEDNAFDKFPAKQAVKKDFDGLLLLQRIVKPRWYVALFQCILNAYTKVKG